MTTPTGITRNNLIQSKDKYIKEVRKALQEAVSVLEIERDAYQLQYCDGEPDDVGQWAYYNNISDIDDVNRRRIKWLKQLLRDKSWRG